MKRKHLISTGVATGVMLLGGQTQAADLTTVSTAFSGNDCVGFFAGDGSNGFDACTIFVNEGGDRIKLSPVIAKYDYDDNGDQTATETNGTLFPSIVGNEFEVTLNGTTNNTGGDWTYNRGTDDPGVRFWVSKAGNDNNGGGFNLYWDVATGLTTGGGVCDSGAGDIYTLDCLNAAQIVTSGSFVNPGDKTLSHVTFYDTGEVPLPAAVWLFGSALLGFAGLARRKQS